MGLTKTEGYSLEQVELAFTLKALAHPARIAILQQIVEADSCICNDLVQELPLAQASVSQHLKALKEAQIIKGSISGNTMCYCLDKETWSRINESLSQLFTSPKCSTDCC